MNFNYTSAKYIVALLLVFGYTIHATAQETSSLLWKISGSHVKSDSYILFGTGGICNVSPLLLAKMSAVSNNIKVYYTETALGNKKYDNESKKFMMIKEGNEPIKKLLSDKNYEALKNKMSKRQIDEKVLNQLSSLVIYNLLLKEASPECGTLNYLETVLKKYSEKYGIEVRELLSTKESFDFLYSYNDTYYVNEIEDLLNNEEVIKGYILSKSKLYEAENIAGLKELFAKSRFLNSKFADDKMISKHIKEIADKMGPVVNGGGALITLDLGNILDSKNNILNELKTRGYIVTTAD